MIKRHVRLLDNDAGNALLAVTRTELIAKLGSSRTAKEQFDDPVIFGVSRKQDLVDVDIRRALVRQR